MKGLFYGLAVILVLVGLVWLFQGIGVLPGSFMTGQIRWALAGAASILIGIGLGIYNRRKS